MIIDYEYSNKNLIVSYINKLGKIKLKYYPWTPTKFIKTSYDDSEKDEKYVTWDGHSVKQIYTKYPNKYSVHDFLDSLPEKEQEDLFEYNEPNIYFVDIENEITDEKPQAHLASTKVLSISIVNKNKVLVLGIDKLSDKEIRSIQNDINLEYGQKYNKDYIFKYVYYKNEYDMLLNFFYKFVPRMDVITGWYFTTYDWVFLVNRARKIGINPNVSSFTKKLKQPNRNNPDDHVELPYHRIIIDYMELYKKWDTSIKIKESDSLDFVSGKILGIKKVNYEGNLKILYETNFKKFIFYNAVDSILVQLIHEKMKYADILYAIAVLSRTKVTSALSTIAVTEGIFRKDLREKKGIVLISPENVGKSNVKGGWVKEPIRGMATWTVCYDFSSLYPSSIRQFKISADLYKGQVIKTKKYSIFNGQQIPIENNDIVTVSGAVFRNGNGIVSNKLGEIFKDRKKYKKMMIQKHKEMSEIEEEIKQLESEIIN